MEVQVVLREVGEAGDVEGRRRRPGPAPARGWTPPSRRPCTPRSTITASSACRSVASGVVRTLSTRSSPTRVSMVPTSPVRWPAPRQRGLDQVRRRRLAVGAGDPEHQQLLGRPAVDRRRRPRRAPPAGRAPRAGAGRSRRRAGARPGRSGPRRPRPRRPSRELAPCARAPGSAAYRSPGRTARESRVTPVTGGRGAGRRSALRPLRPPSAGAGLGSRSGAGRRSSARSEATFHFG